MRGRLVTSGLARLWLRPVCGARSVSGGGAGPDQVLEAEDHRAWTPETPVRLRLTETGKPGERLITAVQM